MIQLNDELRIGQGNKRICYQHPEDLHKCIKINRPEKADCPATEEEAAYFKKLSRLKPDLDYSGVCRFYGFVETNLGRGGVFELIRDEDTGEVSPTLQHYLKNGEVAEAPEYWGEILRNFREWVMANTVFANFHHKNLCAKKCADGSVKLVAIDGIGHHDFIPVVDYVRLLAERKLARHLKRSHLDSVERLIARAGK